MKILRKIISTFKIIWKFSLIVIAVATLYHCKHVYNFRQIAKQLEIQIQPVTDINLMLIFTIFAIIFKKGSTFFLKNWINSTIEKCHPEEKWALKKKKANYQLSSFLWYSMLLIIGIYLSWGDDAIPTCTMGSGDCKDIIANWPHDKSIKYQNLFYCLEMGGKISSLVLFVLFDRDHREFIEMLFHHFITIVLMVNGYFINIQAIGIGVLFLHDSGDWVINFSKILRDMTPKKSNIKMLGIPLSFYLFIYYRCYVHLKCYMYNMAAKGGLLGDYGQPFPKVSKYAPAWEEAKMVLNFETYMLCLLWILNFLWSLMIFIAVLRGVIGKGYEDPSQVVRDQKEREKKMVGGKKMKNN